MGLFGKKKPQAVQVSGEPYPLREGTSVNVVDIDEAFVERARQEPKQPRIGHVYPVALYAHGSEIVVLADGAKVGRLDPEYAHYYLGELYDIQRRGKVGTTFAWIKPATAKSSHCVSLNYSENALAGGGIL